MSRTIFISGPRASGKTTLAMAIADLGNIRRVAWIKDFGDNWQEQLVDKDLIICDYFNPKYLSKILELKGMIEIPGRKEFPCPSRIIVITECPLKVPAGYIKLETKLS